MRIRNWVDLSPYGLKLTLLRPDENRMFYAVHAADRQTGIAPEHAAPLAAMGFSPNGRSYCLPAIFGGRDQRPINQPEAMDFAPGFPLVREIPFDQRRDFFETTGRTPARAPAPSAPGQAHLDAIAAAADAHKAHGVPAVTLERLMAGVVGFARDNGLDPGEAFDMAAPAAPRP